MDEKTALFYEQHAAELAARYEAAPSPIARFLPLSFPGGSRVLDVGAGSGRDLAAMLLAGYDAYGVEPCSSLREAALAAHPELATKLSEGALPSLGMPFGESFDGVVCCAVLMHLPESELFDAALALRSLLKPHGRLLISIPTARTDVGPDHRDNRGRLFQPYMPEELELLFERLGFRMIGRWDTEDVLQRSGTNWVTMLFERGDGLARAVDQIEGILNRDRKVATYKLALFRALAEIATQEPRAAKWLPGGRVMVPMSRIAKRWLSYYWPIFASERLIPQSQAEGAGNQGQPVAFRAAVKTLMQHFAGQGDHGGLTAWHLASSSCRLGVDVLRLEQAALRSIASTIRSGPVAFSGGALDSGTVFEYDARSKGVLMKTDLWSELCLLGHWIIDAVVVRWAALTERFSHRQAICSSDVLPLLLAKPEPKRATELARVAYVEAGVSSCVWTGRSLNQRRFDVDHVIPFSLWGNNDLWNLLPAHPLVNGQKSDSLPSSDLLLARRIDILANWELLMAAMPEAFRFQASSLLGSAVEPHSRWLDQLFVRMREAVDVTALQRGVERWWPTGAVS